MFGTTNIGIYILQENEFDLSELMIKTFFM